MNLIQQSEGIQDYLVELDEVNFSHASIQLLVGELFNSEQSVIEKVQIAYHFVRDEIAHSWDIRSEVVTVLHRKYYRISKGFVMQRVIY